MGVGLTTMIGLAAGLGACARLAIMKLFNHSNHFKKFTFPVSTFLINISGSIILAALFWHFSQTWVIKILSTGFLGGFTTFSTFNNELIMLWQNKHYSTCLIYGIATYMGGLGAAIIGIWL
ncbi:fluoride efflux transporter FluC [Paucilactobacillus kaifaensis]|uniref:fluoride efflux transporter FluC n=1 Tax=Paucilactobacillus kaifaensis TaxID=2559921 RepID=UPI00148570C4|nr:CrcB family protein [Paucilactobacillus kaifaensis]